MKRSSPLARLLGCSHTRLDRYRTVLRAVMFLLLLLHMLVELGGMDTRILHSKSERIHMLKYLCLYLVLSVTQKLSARGPIWGLVVLAPQLIFVWLLWNHAVSARRYLLQTLCLLTVAMILPEKTKAVLVKQTSPDAQAVAQAAINPPADGQDGQPPFVILRSARTTDLPLMENEHDEPKERPREKTPIVVATIRTTNGWLHRHLAALWRSISSVRGIDAVKDATQLERLSLEYATSPTATSDEEVRVSVLYEGPLNPLGKGMDDLALFDADQVLFIAGGMPGYLAYPAYFTYVAARRRKRAICNARVIWTVNSRSGTCCAIPRRLLTSDAFQDDGGGRAVVLCPDAELVSDGEAEGVATVPQPGTARKSCSLTGPCSHANIPELIERLMRRNPGDSVAVVVLGPVELEREARRAMRSWVMRGRKVWWLFENFGM
ncbi:hypothetical protein IF1G_10676 [Cordyceps javanica]|uniref:Uncharacterized protein n=1 Tax=Cordyceps javanica TaxID=43265 RepID=A0A545UMN6_9HYPO|nr:hypothetical protein IF1G_10676 [Cordyceps javanica]